MRKFECEVKREDRYVVSIDEDIIDEKWMEEFRDFFYDYYTLEEHAEHIAQHRARFGRGFIEGYGHLLENGELPFLPEDRYYLVNMGISIDTISEDRHVDVEVLELE